MPCRDEGYDRTVIVEMTPTQKRMVAQHDLLTRLSCAYCTFLEKSGAQIPTWAADWWIEHKRLDAVRLQKAKEARGFRNRKRIEKNMKAGLRAKLQNALTAEELKFIKIS